MKKGFIGILGLLMTILVISCTSNNDFEKGKQQLEQQGYTDVVNTGFSPLCKGDDDSFSTGFKAKDSQGNEIKGCFTSGILKGVSIRFQ